MIRILSRVLSLPLDISMPGYADTTTLVPIGAGKRNYVIPLEISGAEVLVALERNVLLQSV